MHTRKDSMRHSSIRTTEKSYLDKESVLGKLEKLYADSAVDHLDVLTVQYESRWFNLRPSDKNLSYGSI